MNKTIDAILIDKLGVDEEMITPDADLRNHLGCDSLDLVEIVMEIEKEMNITIDEYDLEKFRKVSELYECVDKLTK